MKLRQGGMIMVGILVIGHAQFANGLTSAVELIAGKQENYKVLHYESASNLDDFVADIQTNVDALDNEVGTIIFTDLKGGTPYKEAINVSLEHDNVEVITGTNLAMLIEAALMRLSVVNIEEFAQSLVETGLGQVEKFDKESLKF